MAAELLPIAPPTFRGNQPYGLFAAADPEDGVTGAALAGIKYPYRCDPATDTWPGPCADVPPGEQKNLPAGMDQVEAYSFAVYAFEVCPLVGYNEGQLEALARDSLRRGEQHDVERGVWFGRGEFVGLTQRDDVTVLAAQPVTPVQAMALAEYWLGRQDDGRGVIHVNPVAATPLRDANAIWRDGALYRSTMGHAMSLGGGYGLTGPAGTTTGPGVAWMFVTRGVRLLRSDIIIRSGLRPQSNEHDSRAERVYVPIIPCPIAAVPVQVLPVDVPIPDLNPPFSLTAAPESGPAPLTVTAVVTGEQGPVDITWGDEA